MGFFNDNEPDAPPIIMNDYQPKDVSAQVPTVNFLQAFDAVSGEEVSFVRGVDGEKYLEIKSRYEDAKKRAHEFDIASRQVAFGDIALKSEADKYRGEADRLKSEMDAAKSEQEQSTGSKPGEIRLSFKDLSGKPAIDAPIDYNDVNTSLPSIKDLPAFNMRYAAAVSNLTANLRQLSNTIENVSNTNPELIAQNQGLINSFKQAQKQALNRNFDIKKSGLDLQLAKMGLSNSSTAIGTQINLLRERQEAEVNNAFKTSQLAQGLKQETLQNMFTLGNQIMNEAGVELNKYGQESRNELVARGQDQDQERMIQERASRQVGYDLAKNDQIINSELGRRQLRLAQSTSRNLPALALGFANNSNQQALAAAGLTAQTNLGLQQNQLAKSGLEQQQFQYQQQAKPDLFGNLFSTGLGAAVGAATGGAGAYAGNFLGSNLFGEQYKPKQNANRREYN